jgi:hypothetical protein
MIKENHEWLHAHSGVDRTILHLTQCHPLETSKDGLPNVRQDVRQYTKLCHLSENGGEKWASRFVTSTLKSMQLIAMDHSQRSQPSNSSLLKRRKRHSGTREQRGQSTHPEYFVLHTRMATDAVYDRKIAQQQHRRLVSKDGG